MPLYVEKSVRAGLFRFDASEAGAGFSVDAQLGGLGLPPRFHVIRSEQGGFRYKGAVAPSKRVEHGAIVPSQPKVTLSSNVEMIEVESDDVLQMRDEKFASILDDINTQVRAVRWASILPTVMSIVALVAALVVNPACLKLIVLALPLLLVGKWIDAGRRVTVLLYELDERTMRAFTRVTEAFDLMMSCSGAWHIEAGGAVSRPLKKVPHSSQS